MIASPGSGAIDVHSHYLSKAHLQSLLDGVGPGDDGIVLPVFSVSETLSVMDGTGLAASVLSPISPAPTFSDATAAATVCRATNEGLAEIVAGHPARFGAVAFLPMPFVDVTLQEARYALDELELDGVHLFTSFDGKYLGHPEFRPLLAELNERGSTVVVHPTTPAGSEIVSMGWPGPTLEFVFDTTRTAGDLLFSGALAAYPDISWILPHGGGTLLPVIERLIRSVPILRRQPGNLFPGMPPTEQATRELLGSLYFDVCWNTHSPVLGALAEIMGPDHLLFGTDRPFPVPVAADLALLDNSPDLDQAGKQLIRRDNALRLFTSVAARIGAHEMVVHQ